MRRVLLLSLLGLLACGDAGVRDRSLESRAGGPVLLRRTTGADVPPLGLPDGGSLVPDSLAVYYAEDADLVARFTDLRTLDLTVVPQLAPLAAAWPWLSVPTGSATDALRTMLELPAGVLLDPVKPFALVRRDGGWVAVLPTRSVDEGRGRLKQLDAYYCVAGDPARIASYEMSFAKDTRLPGDVSLIGTPAAFAQLGTLLGVPALDRALADVPKDATRLDAALTLRDGDTRVDARIEAGEGTPTAHYLLRMAPAEPDLVRFLPPNASLYVEQNGWLPDAAGLVENLLHSRRGTQPRLLEPLNRSLPALFEGLGGDFACALDLEPDGGGALLAVSEVADPKAADAFFGSLHFDNLLRTIAGEGGHMEWKDREFVHNGVRVGSITGSVSRSRILAWQASGDYRLATLSKLLRGPVVVYVARVETRLCICTGLRARGNMTTLLDVVMRDKPLVNDHVDETAPLFPRRIAALSLDAAELFEGLREAAPYWHPRTRPLRDLPAKQRTPIAVAATAEGDALRLALRFRTVELAAFTQAIRDRLAAD